jgi:Co/Zn/Cd efflux system component
LSKQYTEVNVDQVTSCVIEHSRMFSSIRLITSSNQHLLRQVDQNAADEFRRALEKVIE